MQRIIVCSNIIVRKIAPFIIPSVIGQPPIRADKLRQSDVNSLTFFLRVKIFMYVNCNRKLICYYYMTTETFFFRHVVFEKLSVMSVTPTVILVFRLSLVVHCNVLNKNDKKIYSRSPLV